MNDVPPEYSHVFDELAATVPQLETAFRYHLSFRPDQTLSDRSSALVMAVVDLARSNCLRLLGPFFEALPPVYEINNEALTFYLYEGFMESLVFQLDNAQVPLSEVRDRMAGEALFAWDAAVDYMLPDSGPNAGA